MKIRKYNAEQLKELPLTEIAYLYMSGLKRPVSFNKLADTVFERADNLEEKDGKLGQFYTDLTIDGRFVTFSNGKWDLRYRHRFEAYEWEDELDAEIESGVEDAAPLELLSADDDEIPASKAENVNLEEIAQRAAEEDEDYA